MPRTRFLTAVIVLALAGAGFYAVRTVHHVIYWSDPAHRDQAPEGWMTLGYIERSHRLPPRTLGPALGFETDYRRQPLEDIAEARGIPLEDLLAIVRREVEALEP
ncbi:hypothetical protein [Salipiger mucosus]|uniref:hypothetical protein n=1 Tax=Salipiger mucosus TaxID=263378 RepID=UPI0012EC404D|nr:hypothetical protein [Salipiger mucosus]